MEYKFMQIYGSCAAVHYLGPDRIKGPVDNVIAKGTGLLLALLNETYLEHIRNNVPEEKPRTPLFDGDSPVYYCYDIVNIVHEDPRTTKYHDNLTIRLMNFKLFLQKVKTDPNYYFVYSLNIFDIDKDHHKLRGNSLLENIKLLAKYNLLNKVIFVGCTPGKTGRLWWDFWTNDLIPLIKKYKLKYTEVTEMCYGITLEQDRLLAAQFQKTAANVIKYGTDKLYLTPRNKDGKFIVPKKKKSAETKKVQSYLNSDFFGL